MNKNPLDVDKVLILALDKRKDLWFPLMEQCGDKGWDVKVFIVGDGSQKQWQYSWIDQDKLPPVWPNSIQYPSWWDRPNAYNAWQSHKMMIQECLAEEYESVLFLEDDVTFTENWNGDVDRLKTNYSNWDMVYLGSFLNEDFDPGFVKLNGNAGGWHSVCMKRDVLRELYKLPPLGPFDYLCQQYIQPHFNCYACVPQLMRQQGTFSYVEGHYLGRRAEDNYQ